jgi:hypothetical protein
MPAVTAGWEPQFGARARGTRNRPCPWSRREPIAAAGRNRSSGGAASSGDPSGYAHGSAEGRSVERVLAGWPTASGRTVELYKKGLDLAGTEALPLADMAGIGRVGYLLDPDGNVFGLSSPVLCGGTDVMNDQV